MFDFKLRDFLSFDKMLTPSLLTVLYYIAMALTLLFSFGAMISGLFSDYGGGSMILGGLFGLLLGPVFVRVSYELVLIVFQIHGRLASIDNKMGANTVNPGGAANPFVVPTPHPVAPPQPTATAPIADFTATRTSVNESIVGLPADGKTVNQSASVADTGVKILGEPVANESEKLPETPYQRPVSPTAEPTPPIAPGTPFPFNTETVEQRAGEVLRNISEFGQKVGTSARNFSETFPKAESSNLVSELRAMVPNWPATIASLVVLYAFIAPYAKIATSLPFLGNVPTAEFNILNGSLGSVALIGAMALIALSAAGWKWIAFVIAYAVTLLSILATFFTKTGFFSQYSAIKSSMSQITGSALGGFLNNQAAAQLELPSTFSCLTIPFYLLVAALIFIGYWIFADKYRQVR